MVKKKLSSHFLSIFLLTAFFLMGNVLTAQTHKVQKDGKYKGKKSHSADHHNRGDHKKQHHKSDFGHHSQDENKVFSKKKKKKLQ